MNDSPTQGSDGKNVEKKEIQLKYVVLPITKTDVTYTQYFETVDIHEAMVKVNDQIKNGLGEWVIVTSVEDKMDTKR